MDHKMTSFLKKHFATTKALDLLQCLSTYNVNPVSWPRWVFRHIPKTDEQRILEIGSGNGELWSENRAHIPRESLIVLSDLHLEMVRAARTILKSNSEIVLIAADAMELPFGGQCFDTVLANNVFHLVPDIGRAVAAVHDLLKTGGTFIFTVMSNDHMKALGDVLRDFGPRYEYPIGGVRRFSMESDKPEVRRLFPEMERFVYTGMLEIPVPELVTEIALSMFNRVIYPDLSLDAESFTRNVRDRMKNRVFSLGLKYGLYVCRKPARGG